MSRQSDSRLLLDRITPWMPRLMAVFALVRLLRGDGAVAFMMLGWALTWIVCNAWRARYYQLLDGLVGSADRTRHD